MYQLGFFGLTPAKIYKQIKILLTKNEKRYFTELLSPHGKELIKIIKNIAFLVQGQKKELNME